MTMTRISLFADPEAAVGTVVETLAAGGVAVFPTETVYGVGVDSGNPGALARLRKVKGRDANKPFQLLIDGIEMGLAMGGGFSPGALRLAGAFWPGPLTLVVPTANAEGTLGLRVPDDPFILAVVGKLGRAVTASSANPAGVPAPTTASQAEDVCEGIDVLVDGGSCRVGLASTVVMADASGGFTILREGAIDKQAIDAAWRS